MIPRSAGIWHLTVFDNRSQANTRPQTKAQGGGGFQIWGSWPRRRQIDGAGFRDCYVNRQADGDGNLDPSNVSAGSTGVTVHHQMEDERGPARAAGSVVG